MLLWSLEGSVSWKLESTVGDLLVRKPAEEELLLNPPPRQRKGLVSVYVT